MLTRNRDGFSVICITLCEVFDGMVFESLVDHNKDRSAKTSTLQNSLPTKYFRVSKLRGYIEREEIQVLLLFFFFF